MDEYMTTGQAAVVLGIDDSQVRRLCRDGVIEAIKPGHDWLPKRGAVEAYKNAYRKRGPKPKKTE